MKFIFNLLNKFVGIFFSSVFFILGLGLLIIAYVIYTNYSYFQNPHTINDFSPGKVVKLSFVPDSDYVTNSYYSKTPCVFSKTEYIQYHANTKSTRKTVEKTITKPDYIVLKNKNDRYLLNFNDLQPRMFISTELFYLKDKTTEQYNQTTLINFSSGDEIIKESLILPDDNITVFGKLVTVKDIPNKNSKELQFYGEKLSPSFESFLAIIKKLPDYLKNNKLIFYFLSTKNSVDTQKAMGMSNGYILGIIGFVIILISGFFILKDVFSIFNKTNL